MTRVNRRHFLKTAAGVAAAAVSRPAWTLPPDEISVAGELPTRPLGRLRVTRLIIGGNPFSFIPHGEPLVYLSELFRQYFTHEKVVETLSLARRLGINTFLGRIDDNVISFLKLYRQKGPRPIQWIGQTAAKPQRGATREEILQNIRLAVDNGADAIYIQGQSADYLVNQGRYGELEEYVAYVRELGLTVGVGAHEITTIEECLRRDLKPDFYMKTFNRLEYCCPNFERTREVMSSIDRPWIAFKVLAAGRLKPEEGFRDALEAGADFLCVGMFDFHVERNVKLAARLFSQF